MLDLSEAQRAVRYRALTDEEMKTVVDHATALIVAAVRAIDITDVEQNAPEEMTPLQHFATFDLLRSTETEAYLRKTYW